MPNIDLSILNQRQTPAFYADVFANRPAAGFVGRIFISTNTFAFYRDNGTSWDLIGGPGTGTVTGTGANGQVTFWNGASTITGSNDLFWDATNGHLGVNTNAPGTALDVHHDQPTVAILNQTVATNDVRIGFQNNGVGLWRIGAFYNAGANDFGLFDIAASTQPVTVKRTTGQTFIGSSTTSSGLFVVNTNTNDNHIVVLGNQAPSIRIRTAGVAAPLQCGIGLSTTTNNFIQGAVGGEFCLYNDSAVSQPILFGVNATTVVLEAARISSARNFLIGTTTDSGEKLIVNGTAKFNGQINGTTLVTSSNISVNGTQIGINSNSFTTGAPVLFLTDTYTAGPARNVCLVNGYDNYGTFSIKMSPSVGTSALTGNAVLSIPNTQNLLIGTTTDAGQKLQVNGNSFFNGNVGIGVSASTGGLSSYYLLQIGGNGGGSIYSGTNQTLLGTNISWSGGTATYIANNYSTLYNQQSGQHQFATAAIGTPGNNITFTTQFTLKANGIINMSNVPTSSAGLVSGDIYQTAGVLNIVP